MYIKKKISNINSWKHLFRLSNDIKLIKTDKFFKSGEYDRLIDDNMKKTVILEENGLLFTTDEHRRFARGTFFL